MKHLLILGAGAGGRAAAVAAASRRERSPGDMEEIAITVVDRANDCSIPVRNYQGDVVSCCLPLADILLPLGVRCLTAQVTGIDFDQRQVSLRSSENLPALAFDALILALGAEGLQLEAITTGGALEHQPSGRLKIDASMAASRVGGVYAVGEMAEPEFASELTATDDAGRLSETEGRVAGENAIRALRGEKILLWRVDTWTRYQDFVFWGEAPARA